MLAAVDDLEVCAVDVRVYGREGRVAGVDVRQHVPRCVAERGDNLVAVGPEDDEEVARHAWTVGDTTPSCAGRQAGHDVTNVLVLVCRLSRSRQRKADFEAVGTSLSAGINFPELDTSSRVCISLLRISRAA